MMEEEKDKVKKLDLADKTDLIIGIKIQRNKKKDLDYDDSCCSLLKLNCFSIKTIKL